VSAKNGAGNAAAESVSDPKTRVTRKNAQAVARKIMTAGFDSLPQSEFNNAADLSIHLATASVTEAHVLWLRKAGEKL
jgi:hypothetical protein